MHGFVTEDMMKYRVRELREEAARARNPVDRHTTRESGPPKTVLFRGHWMPLDELPQEAARL